MKKLIKAKGTLANWQDNALLALEAMNFSRLTYNIIRTQFIGENGDGVFGVKIEAGGDGKVALHLDGDDAQIEQFKKLSAAAFKLKAGSAKKESPPDEKPVLQQEKTPEQAPKEDGLPVQEKAQLTDEASLTRSAEKSAVKRAKKQKAPKQRKGFTFGKGLLIFIVVLFGAMAIFAYQTGMIGKIMENYGLKQKASKKKATRQAETYEKVDLKTMFNEFYSDFNACNKKYTDKQVEVTGVIQSMDSTYGSHFSLTVQDTSSLKGNAVLDCIVHSNAMRGQVKQYKVGSTVTVKGTITQVGDTFGFSMDDVESVKAAQ